MFTLTLATFFPLLFALYWAFFYDEPPKTTKPKTTESMKEPPYWSRLRKMDPKEYDRMKRAQDKLKKYMSNGMAVPIRR